jgi:hypothetical protein
MKMKFRAAVGSMLVSAAVVGAAVAPATSSAHGNNGPLCYGNDPSGLPMSSMGPGLGPNLYLNYNEAFRIKETVLAGDEFYSLGHSASSYPVDYWVLTPGLRCF